MITPHLKRLQKWLVLSLLQKDKGLQIYLENFEKNKKITIDEKVKEINKIFGDLL
jgi:hypothetical protein